MNLRYIVIARQMILDAERDADHYFSPGEMRDLLCDNTTWSTGLISNLVDKILELWEERE